MNLPNSIKVSLENENRRVPFKAEFLEFQILEKHLRELLGLQHFSIKYKDDEGDMVTICTDEELKEAIKNSNQKILRIFVTKTAGSKTSPKQEAPKKCPLPKDDPFSMFKPFLDNLLEDGSIQEIIEKVITGGEETLDGLCSFINIDNLNTNSSQHMHHAFCDRCDKRIAGIRWKCFDCSDFDYCDACYQVANGKEDQKGHLKSHIFGKIEDPNTKYNFNIEFEKHQEKRRIEKLEKEKQEKEEKERREKEQQEKEKLEREKQEKEEKERREKEQQEKKEKEMQEKKEEPKIIYPFEQKLQDLEDMGFSDRKSNISALIKTKGDINRAVQFLLEMN